MSSTVFIMFIKEALLKKLVNLTQRCFSVKFPRFSETGYTKLCKKPQRTTTSHNDPQRTTASHKEPKRVTTNHKEAHRTTTRHNQPQPATTNYNEP